MLQDQIIDRASKQLSEKIDFDIISNLLIKECGWQRVEGPSIVSETTAKEIREWMAKPNRGHIKSVDGTWLFEKSEDATWFILKWL